MVGVRSVKTMMVAVVGRGKKMRRGNGWWWTHAAGRRVGSKVIDYGVPKLTERMSHHYCSAFVCCLEDDVVTATEVMKGDRFSPSDADLGHRGGIFLKLNQLTSTLQSCMNQSRQLNWSGGGVQLD